jgi:hypothetical protein
MALVVIASMLFAYVGSYYCISRRGMAEVGPRELWLYVPLPNVEDDLQSDRWEFLEDHQFYYLIYAPLSWVDHKILGNPHPVRGGTWKLS